MNHASYADGNADGYVLIGMMLALTSGAIMLALGWNQARAVQAHELLLASSRVDVVAQAVRDFYLARRTMPQDMAVLEPFVSIDVLQRWRSDPLSQGEDLDYSVIAKNPSRVIVRSRGSDGILGTSDDLSVTVDEQLLGRQGTHIRLRLVRAAVFGSDYMTPRKVKQRDVAALREETFIYIEAQRELLNADIAQRARITVRRNTAAARIATLRKHMKARHWPKDIVGRKGLLHRLKLDADFERDGFGSYLIGDTAVGVLSAGGDRQGGTLDDL